MIREQLLREIHKCLVIISVSLASLMILTYSCKSLGVSDDKKYLIINTLLDNYTQEHDSVYLYPKIIKAQGRIVKDFFKTYRLENVYFDKCGDRIKNIVLNNEEIAYYKNTKDNYEKWDYAKITSPKVFTRLELKRPESIARYKKLAETIKDEYDLLARKYMLWSFEHKERRLQLSHPFFPRKNKDYAICFVSELNEGDFVWIFHKEKKKWNVICKMRLNYH